jgi:hypothetical protein
VEHNSAAVRTIQKKVLENMIQHLPNVKKVIYFMNGAAAQDH